MCCILCLLRNQTGPEFPSIPKDRAAAQSHLCRIHEAAHLHNFFCHHNFGYLEETVAHTSPYSPNSQCDKRSTPEVPGA